MAKNQGIQSKNVTHRPHGKTEPVANKYRPQGVAQYGQMQGTHTTNRTESSYRGEPKRGGRGYEPPGMISDPVKAVGVGGGRTIYKTGTQDQYGSGGPAKPAGREILGSFGPESKRS
jgi:hypothetical protein